MAWPMESDLNSRSESSAGRVNVNDSAMSAGGSFGLRSGSGTEYDKTVSPMCPRGSMWACMVHAWYVDDDSL